VYNYKRQLLAYDCLFFLVKEGKRQEAKGKSGEPKAKSEKPKVKSEE